MPKILIFIHTPFHIFFSTEMAVEQAMSCSFLFLKNLHYLSWNKRHRYGQRQLRENISSNTGAAIVSKSHTLCFLADLLQLPTLWTDSSKENIDSSPLLLQLQLMFNFLRWLHASSERCSGACSKQPWLRYNLLISVRTYRATIVGYEELLHCGVRCWADPHYQHQTLKTHTSNNLLHRAIETTSLPYASIVAIKKRQVFSNTFSG